MIIGGLDIGSTGAKITVMDHYGQSLFTSNSEYKSYQRTDIGVHEINAEDIWDAVKTILRKAVEAVRGISAIGITSFGESFALIGDNGEVLSPSMMYTDPRGANEAAALAEILGSDFICATAGTAAHPMFSLPKLMWIKANNPEIYTKTQYIFLIGDYLAYKLTGRRLIDYSLAARTMGFDIRAKKWSEDIFEAAGINPSLFSEPAPTGSIAGTVLPAIAAELGLPNELQIVICGHDQVAAAVGSGVMREGIATDGGGTVQCMTPVFSHIPEGRAMQDYHYSIVPFLKEDSYCCYAFIFTGGSLIKWFIDNFAAQYRGGAAQAGVSVYEYIEAMMNAAPTGILTLPHFAGAATPYMDVNSRGAFVGLELTHTPADLYKSIMEGIAYEMRINMERLSEGGIIIRGLNATGGCAKSRLWLQMKADILGIPISRMNTDEAGTIGGIMLTGSAVGAYAGLEAAANTLMHTVETFHPNVRMHERYEKHYRRYKKLYEAIRPLVCSPDDK